MTRALKVWLLALLVMAGCTPGAKPYAPVPLPPVKNVILISIDTLRADRLGAYGYRRPTSPHIDALAKEAVRFDRAYSSSNWTLPGHAGLLTGRMSTWHGGILIGNALRENVPLVSQVVQGAGLETAAFVSHVFVSDRYGFDRGFEIFDYQQNIGSADLTDKALGWLRGREGEKGFFLFLHYFDVHNPYGKADAPVADFTKDESCRGPVPVTELVTAAFNEQWDRFDCYRDLYDADVALVDRELGRLFDHLRDSGRLEDTLVIVTADHGELLGKGEGVTHGITLLEPEILVPLILRWPGGAAGNTRVPAPISTIQVAPTILEALNLPVFDTDLPGLQGLLKGAPPPVFVSSETGNSGYAQIAVIKDHHKLFQPPPYNVIAANLAPILVDLDQSEQADIWDAQPGVAREMTDLARQSGWYGEGVCHEFAYRVADLAGVRAIRIKLPEGVKPIYVRALRRLFSVRKDELVERQPRVGHDENEIVLTLERQPGVNGIAIVVPPGTPVTAQVVTHPQGAPPAMWIDNPQNPWRGDAVELPLRASPWQPEVEPEGNFVRVRSYSVLHLERPAAGPGGEQVELTPMQQRMLRTLGYIGM